MNDRSQRIRAGDIGWEEAHELLFTLMTLGIRDISPLSGTMTFIEDGTRMKIDVSDDKSLFSPLRKEMIPKTIASLETVLDGIGKTAELAKRATLDEINKEIKSIIPTWKIISISPAPPMSR